MKRVDELEQAIVVARHVDTASAYAVANTLSRLRRIGRLLHGLYEINCNEPVEVCDACGSVAGRKHKPSECFYARLERLEVKAEVLAKALGLAAHTQRDPRGPAIRLTTNESKGERVLACF